MASIQLKIKEDIVEELNELPGDSYSQKIRHLIDIKTSVPIETVKKALKEVIKENGLVIGS